MGCTERVHLRDEKANGRGWRGGKEGNPKVCHIQYCLLHVKVPEDIRSNSFDKTHSTQSDDNLLVPISPAVLVAYRTLFWDALLDYVTNNEVDLLQTCANPMVTNDVRGRPFELIVITRCQKRSTISLQPEADVLPGRVDTGMVFESQELRDPSKMDANTRFIPKNSNFPACDLILKQDRQVWVIQVHVSDHDDVEPCFRSMCKEKGWFESFDDIFLVYLSPSAEVTEALSCLP